MNRNELKQLIKGTIVTLPTPMDEAFHVDYGCLADLTQWLVAQGCTKDIAPLKVCAAMGEGPDMSDDEWPLVLRTAVQNAGRNDSVICGIKPKNTIHTIDDAKKAADLGAIGVQIDLPLFHHSNRDDMVRFFSDISAKIDIGIVIYNTYWFGIEHMDAPTMLRLKDAEHVVAIKWNVPPPHDYDQMREFAHIFNVIDNSSQPVRAHKNGAAGYISSTIAAYPQHDLKVWRLLEAKQYDEADRLFNTVSQPIRELGKKFSQRSGGYRAIKGMMAIMGKPVGPPRPPTLPLDEQELAQMRRLLISVGWPVPQ